MKILFLLALLFGCGKKTVWTYPPLPENQASPEVNEEINLELDKLQQEFSDINVTVNLKRLPVVVAPLPFGVVGRCQYGEKNKGAYIVLSPTLFYQPDNLSPADEIIFEKEFVRVLIHEIGHCYFYRQHERPTFVESPGNAFELRHEGSAVIFDKIPTSLMPAEATYRMPKSLRKYYLAEVARKARLSNPVGLERYTEFQIVSNSVPSDAVQPADKDGGEVTKLFKCSGTEHAPQELGNLHR